MSIKKSFRLTVDLSDFFDDHRRLSLILIREKYKKIGEVESRICKVFDVQDIYLSLDNVCLPSNEDIKILTSNDIVQVRRKQDTSVQTEDSVHKHKQKKKKVKEIEDNNENDQDITDKIKKHKHEKESEDPPNKKSKKRKSDHSSIDDETSSAGTLIETTPELKPKNKIKTPHNGEINSKQTSLELDSNMTNKTDLIQTTGDDDMEIEQNTTSMNDTLDLEIQPKRRRVRKRYRKKKQNQLESSCNERNFAHSTLIVPKPLTPLKTSNNHIRFEKYSDGNQESTENHACTENHESTRKSSEYQSADDHNSAENHDEKQSENSSIEHAEVEEQSPLCNGDSPAIDISNSEKNSTKDLPQGTLTDETIAKYGVDMNTLQPKVGDIVSFKIVKLSSSYTPEVSSLIVGKILNFNESTKTVEFLITQGADEFVDPMGKFSLEKEEEKVEIVGDKQTLNWSNLLEPKLLYP